MLYQHLYSQTEKGALKVLSLSIILSIASSVQAEDQTTSKTEKPETQEVPEKAPESVEQLPELGSEPEEVTAEKAAAGKPSFNKWYLIGGGAAAGLAALAGGGGGGGGGGSSAAPADSNPPTSPPDSGTSNLVPRSPDYYNTEEYQRRSDLDQINAKEAYSNISSTAGAKQAGEGITIAMLDSGVNTTHNDLNESIDLPNCGTQTCDVNYGEQDSGSHGTHVAGIAAADKDGTGIHGVAYNADVLSGCANIDGGCGVPGVTDAALLQWAASQGASVANMSYAYVHDSVNRGLVASDIVGVAAGQPIDYSNDALKSYLFSTAGSTRYQQAQNALKTGLVGVVAAGNHAYLNENTHPEVKQSSILTMAPSIYQGTSLQNDLTLQWISVVNVDSNNQLHSSSHGCGDSAAYCLAAPGTNIYSTVPGGHGYKTGTSMAAPQVSGAYAVVAAAFPGLQLPGSNSLSYLCNSSDARANSKQCHSKAVVNRLFVSADDLGAPGVDAVYGQGMLNLQAATQLIGVAQLQAENGQLQNVSDSNLDPSSASGDQVGQQLSEVRFLAVDSYDKAGFVYSGSALIGNNYREDIQRVNADRYFNESRSRALSRAVLPGGVTLSFSQSSDKPLSLETLTGTLGFAMNKNQTVFFSQGLDASSTFGVMANESMGIQELTSTRAFANPFQSFNEAARGVHLEQRLDHGITLKAGAFQGEPEKASRGGVDSNFESLNAELSTALSKNLNVSLSVGSLRERNSVLGAEGSGVWDFGQGSQTHFYGVNFNYQMSESTGLLLGYYQGLTRNRANSTVLVDHSDKLLSDSLSLGAINQLDDKTTVAAFITRPMAIQSGEVDLRLPQGYQGSNLQYQSVNIDYAPEHRQTDYEVVVRREFPELNAFGKVNLLRVENANNVQGLDDTMLMMSVGFKF
ncbi:S8 family peptidase [Endozoicomonas arenosclerae]|uniref:S8 family peptidase n=1 Tax=Endozoicomonas arenosclerae TaxID=1633495 RepID=UPI0007809B73|nr:S8 family peptidase [Endozoicomonas arenosclerae]